MPDSFYVMKIGCSVWGTWRFAVSAEPEDLADDTKFAPSWADDISVETLDPCIEYLTYK